MKVVTDTETIDLGVTETRPTISLIDYSRRVTDDFGVTTVVERGFARRLSVKLAVPFEAVDGLQRQLAALRASAATWIADEALEWLQVAGFYKEFQLDLNVPPLSYCTLTVEGLAETETVADAGGDPAPNGRASSLLLLQPVTVTDALLVSHSVPENDYPEWAAGTTYAAGARVIKAATHRIYESAAAGNVGHDPEALTGEWIDIGPTNRWAMFDQALGTLTSATDSVSVTLDPGAIDGVALLDVTGATVRVQATGYDRTQPAGAGAVTFLDLPGSAGPVTVTVAGIGPVAVGTLLVGQIVALGETEASPTAGINDFSRKETDDFGEVTIVERAWAKRMTARALIRTDAVDVVANRIAAVRARPSLWIGDEGTDSLTIYGFFKDFAIEVGEAVSTLSLSIEGLSRAPPPAEPTPLGPIGWTDIVDDDPAHPKPDDGADVTGENTALDTEQVGGVPAEDLVEAVGSATDALAQLESDIAANESAIGTAQAQISGLLGDFDALQDDFTDLNTGVTTLSNAVQGAEASAVAQRTIVSARLGAAAMFNTPADLAGWTSTPDWTATPAPGSNAPVPTPGGYPTVAPSWGDGSYLQAAAGQWVDLFSIETIPVDTFRKYRISTRIGAYNSGDPTADPSWFYVGFAGLDADGNLVDHGDFGNYRYAATNGAAILSHDQLVSPSQLVTGEGNDSWLKFPPGTKKIALVARLNHGAVSNLHSYLKYVTFQDVTDFDGVAATVSTHTSALATLDSQYASLSSEVGVQGVTVSEHTSAIAAHDSEISTLLGKWGVKIEVDPIDGQPMIAGIDLFNTGTFSLFRVLATIFEITSGTASEGTAFTQNVWRVWSSTHMLAFGISVGFGTTGQFILWYGPSPTGRNIALCDDASALFSLRRDGILFYGGASANSDYVQKSFSYAFTPSTVNGTWYQAGTILTVFPLYGSTSVSLDADTGGSAFGDSGYTWEAKWQYSPDRSTWTDISGASVGGGVVGAGSTHSAGANASGTKTGLTTGAAAYFRMAVRRTAGTGGSFNNKVGGTAEAQAL